MQTNISSLKIKDMENIKIILYALIQGTTEFLPISSSAHLYLLQDFFKWSDSILLLALGAHLGTFLAILFYNRKQIVTYNKDPLIFLAFISSIPVIFFGGTVSIFGNYNFNSNLFIIAIACILGGILLDLSDNYIKTVEKNKITFKDCLLIGLLFFINTL